MSTPAVAAVLAAAATYVALAGDGVDRLARAVGPPSAGRSSLSEPARRRGAIALGAVGAALLVGGIAGAVAAPAVAYALDRVLARLPSRVDVVRGRDVARSLPLACDLLAACLAAGAATPRSLAVVAGAVGGPLGIDLADVARRWLLSGSAESAWSGLADAAPGRPLHPVAVACRRAERGGVPLTALLGELADELRDAARAEGEAAARRAGVYAVAPLGLCFLPAFVLLGVVPLVAGLFSRLA